MEEAIKRIIDGLSWVVFKTRGRTAIRLYDINVMWQKFFQDFLNRLRGLSLKNLNERGRLFPAIDLGDEGRKLSVQVTTEADARKVRETLETFDKHKLHTRYSRLVFLIIGEKKQTYAGTASSTIEFNSGRDVIDIKDLQREVEQLPINAIKDLAELVREYGLSIHDEKRHRETLDSVKVDFQATTERRQIALRNISTNTIQGVWFGSFLLSEDGEQRTVLYDERVPFWEPGDDIVQSDILDGRGRSGYLDADAEYYGSILNDRIAGFTSSVTMAVRLFVALRSVGVRCHGYLDQK